MTPLAALSRAWRLLRIGAFALTGLCSLHLFAAEGAEDPAGTRPVFALTTEFYPLATEQKGLLQNRLFREIVRQAVLIAAREELGLATRDETLGEPLPAAAGSQPGPLRLELRATNKGKYHARLFAAGAAGDRPLCELDGEVAWHMPTIYAELARKMAAEAPAIAVKLRDAEFTGDAVPLNKENAPTDDAKRLLSEMNFVSQFGAVRAAHRAIADEGPSIAWMGVLVRGYANLSLLTEHVWSSQQEAFAARSLLYAERMMTLDDAREFAQWHRAYALALVGLHGEAAVQLEKLTASTGSTAAPEWGRLLKPFCQFEHQELAKAAEGQRDVEELATCLQWQLYRSYQHGRWTYQKGLETAKRCPEIYGVYDTMSKAGALLIDRTGGYSAPPVFGSRVPMRVGRLPDLPKEVAELAVADKGGFFSRMLGQEASNDEALSPRPMHIARALLVATENEEAATDLSWAALAALIAEEQFVEIANFLRVAGHGVEHSLAEYGERVMPLVERHRYAPYIRSFALDARRAPEEFNANFQGMEIVDPRGNMRPMFRQTWALPASATGLTGRLLSWKALWSRDLAMGGMLESIYGAGADWWSQMEPKDKKRMARELRQICPRSPNGFRLVIETAEQIDKDRLATWESEATDDPIAWLDLGHQYYRLEDYEAAARCYKRSYDTSPCYDSAVGLASSYKRGGSPERWQPTLEGYLEVEDLGLAHAKIHQLLANELIAERKWAAAEPHALAAAETWSAWGMALASRLYEGMQRWDKSEEWIAESTRNYPSYSSGVDWYFWCCRTGRGDIEAAREYAAKCVEIAATRRSLYGDHYTFIFRLLEGEPRQALEMLDFIGTHCPETVEPEWDKVWRLMHIVALAAELEETAQVERAIAELREFAKTNAGEHNVDWYAAVEMACVAFTDADDEQIDEAFLKRFEETLARTADYNIANYYYFMGAALDVRGRTDEGELYWRRAAFGGPFDKFNATLAGHRLASRYGPERGGIPPELEAQDEPAKTDDDAS